MMKPMQHPATPLPTKSTKLPSAVEPYSEMLGGLDDLEDFDLADETLLDGSGIAEAPLMGTVPDALAWLDNLKPEVGMPISTPIFDDFHSVSRLITDMKELLAKI